MKLIFGIIFFILGCVFVSYHPEYIEFIKEKWEKTIDSTEDYIDKVKEENETVKSIKEKTEKKD